MKNTRKTISTLLFAFLAAFPGASAGDTPATIYTPNGTQVPDTYYRDEIVTPAAAEFLATQVPIDYPGAVVVGDATSTYNCHAYAWRVSEGGSNVWVGLSTTTAEDVYWADGSFVPDGTNYTKISYEGGNHSAIRSSDAGYFVSKWGEWPLVKHTPFNCPFEEGTTNLYGYKRNPDYNEPNNNSSEAAELAMNICTYGYIAPPGDQDWFKVPIGDEGTLTLILNLLPADYDLYLLDPYMNTLAVSENGGTTAEQIVFSGFTMSGYYYIVVVGYDGAYNSNTAYQLDVGWSSTAAKPDLIIEDIQTPTSLAAGEETEITFVVRNQGAGTAPSGWDLGLAINGSPAWGSEITSALAPGAEFPLTLTLSDGLPAGTFSFEMCTDINDDIDESNESNNCMTESFTWYETGLPDIIVEDIQSPTSLNTGEATEITFVLRNQGAATAAAGWNWGLAIDGSPTLSNEITSSLAPGAGIALTVTFNDGVPVGPHSFQMCVDVNSEVAESNEGNNCRTESFTWVETGLPDLVVEDIVTPTITEAGEDTEIVFVIRNQGTATAAGGWDFRIDIDGTSALTGNVADPLSPSAGINLTVTFTGGFPAGGHTFAMCLDVNSEVVESNESNNCRTETWTWTGGTPDLTIPAIQAPTSLIALEDTEVAFTLANIGSATAWGGFDIDVRIDGSSIGTLEITSDLPGESSGTVTVTFNGGFQASTHTIEFVADVNNEVMESDEINNNLAGSWTWIGQPDLLAADIHDPSTLVALASCEIVFVMQNVGNDVAPAGFEAAMTVDGSNIATIPIDINVNPGGSVNITLTVDGGLLAGAHVVGFAVDPGSVVVESNESNNSTAESWTWIGQPDLLISSIGEPSTLYAGQDVEISFRLTNQGNMSVAPAFDVEIQVDGAPLGSIEIDGGMPALTYADFTITITGGLISGSHSIGFYADSQQQIAESDEGNNILSRTWEWNAISAVPIVPATFQLYPCQPNPFNPMTTIAYDLPKCSTVTVSIYDLAGRLVRDLERSVSKEAGHYELVWRGKNNHGSLVSTGIYLCRVVAGEYSATTRMTLLK